MNKISTSNLDLCHRVDFLLKKVETDKDSMYVFATENIEIIKYAFLARAVVRELIDPKPELFESISSIEEELVEYVNQIETDSNNFDSEELDEEDE